MGRYWTPSYCIYSGYKGVEREPQKSRRKDQSSVYFKDKEFLHIQVLYTHTHTHHSHYTHLTLFLFLIPKANQLAHLFDSELDYLSPITEAQATVFFSPVFTLATSKTFSALQPGVLDFLSKTPISKRNMASLSPQNKVNQILNLLWTGLSNSLSLILLTFPLASLDHSCDCICCTPAFRPLHIPFCLWRSSIPTHVWMAPPSAGVGYYLFSLRLQPCSFFPFTPPQRYLYIYMSVYVLLKYS